MMKKCVALSIQFLPFLLFAQTVPEKAPDALEQVMVPGGKIYVVLGVVLLIWIGILFFLFRTDRKLDKIEKELGLKG